MPAAHTKHSGGRPPLDARALRALWFEEGDGVAVIEGGQLLAVIPGWSDMSRGMPGYSRDVMGQTPFGWALDDAMEGLGPRADRATAFWRWRQRDDSWAGFQQSMLGHLLARLGPGARYWDVGGGKQPAVGVSERPPTEQRPYTVLSTLGMSCQRMPVVEQVMEDPSGCARIELAIATTMPSPRSPASSSGWPSTRGGRSRGSGPATASAGTTNPPPSRWAGGTRGCSCSTTPRS